jgi:hypothetical protein
VHRGLVVYEQVYCGVQPPPPGDLDITLPPLDDSLSTRERLARHTQDPLCSGCHQRLDPVGFGFEHYDPIGAWRDTEGDGVPIDASGVLVYGDAAGPFDGALELSALLADDAGGAVVFRHPVVPLGVGPRARPRRHVLRRGPRGGVRRR